MDNLRLVLLLIGLVFFGLFYLWERRRQARKDDWDLPMGADLSGERVEPDEHKPEDEWDIIPLRVTGGIHVDDGALEQMRGITSTPEPLGDDIPTLTDIAAHAADRELPELVIALTVMTHGDKPIQGPRLLEVVQQAGMSYGMHKIFHRVVAGQPLFSMANILEPGYFDLAKIENFTSPGMVFFMRLPGAAKGIDAFQQMADAARLLAQQFDARLCDERRVPISEQGIARLMDKVRPYTSTTIKSI